MNSGSSPFATPTQRLAAFFDTAPPRETYDDAEIEQVALLLQHCNHAAHKAPRTYIVLRLCGHLDILERLLDSGFSDGWFPVESSSLPPFLDPRVKADIVRCQQSVLTRSLHLESGKHCHFRPDEPLPFRTLARLGAGGYGQVDKIESKVTFKQYALKKIHRRAAFGYRSKEAIIDFLQEIRRMRDLHHRHLVKYIGSYTDQNNLGLVMAPVADCDLANYLERACVNTSMLPTIRTSFGCLAAGLSYLHDCQIKHRDIKPGNILVYDSNVLIADFGISHDFLNTTSGATPASPRYCAPEVAKNGKRNWSQDVWSLGCVFLEMVAALHGYNISWMDELYSNIGTRDTYYYENPEATELLVQQWEQSWSREDRKPLVWIRRMLTVDWRARPQAAEMLAYITEDGECMSYCGSCCNPFSIADGGNRRDSLASLFEELDPGLTPKVDNISKTAERKAPSKDPLENQATTPHDLEYGAITTANVTLEELPEKGATTSKPKSTPSFMDSISPRKVGFNDSARKSSWMSFTYNDKSGKWTYGGGGSEVESSSPRPLNTTRRSQQQGIIQDINSSESPFASIKIWKPGDPLPTAAPSVRRAVTPEARADNSLKVQANTASRSSSVPPLSREPLASPISSAMEGKDEIRPTRGEDTSSEGVFGPVWHLQFPTNTRDSASAQVFGAPLSQSVRLSSVIVTKAEWDPYYEPIPVNMKLPTVVEYCTRILVQHGES